MSIGDRTTRNAPVPVRRRRVVAMTLIEVLVVMTVMSVLLAMATPVFHRTVEQSHADLAGANLKAIWNAQRFYWLENHTYCPTISELQSLELLDASLTNATNRYSYVVTTADDSSFVVEAQRANSARWSGAFTINEDGDISGSINASGVLSITPGFQ